MNPWNGTFELVNPRLIVVDHIYQRNEKPLLIADIARAPDWAKFGVVVCAKRQNGMLYCYDGQQRLRGLMASENPPLLIPCVWFPVESVAREAEVFTDMNTNRKNVHSLEVYRARLVQGHPVYVMIDNVVGSLGFSVATNSGGSSNARTIAAIGTLERIYMRSGEEGLRQTLLAIRDAWPNDPNAIGALFLDALNVVLTEHRFPLERSQVKKALQRTTPVRVRQEMERLVYDLGGSKHQNMVRAIRKQAPFPKPPRSKAA